MVTTSDLVPS